LLVAFVFTVPSKFMSESDAPPSGTSKEAKCYR
jgi:hypothetical protein